MRPRLLDIKALAVHLSITEDEAERWAAEGIIPAPRIRNGQRVWLWSSVDNAMSGRGGLNRQIYFVEALGFIKIGITRNLEQRLYTISLDLPCQVALLHSMPGSFDDEVDLHRRFRHLRSRGEWFRKCPEILDYIEQKRGGKFNMSVAGHI